MSMIVPGNTGHFVGNKHEKQQQKNNPKNKKTEGTRPTYIFYHCLIIRNILTT